LAKSTKPTPATKSLQIRQGQIICNCFIADLKLQMESLFFSSSGSEFQSFGPKKDKLSVPLKTDFTLGTKKVSLFLRLYFPAAEHLLTFVLKRLKGLGTRLY